MKKKYRCLFYVHDGYGMGHISRVVYQAKYLKLNYPYWDVIVVTGDKNAQRFLPSNIEFIKLPSFKVESDNEGRMINSPAALSSYSLTSIVRRKLLETILMTYVPGVIIVEHLPRGHGRELGAILREYKRRNPGTQLILGLRGILGTKNYALNTVLTSIDIEYIKNVYDTIFAYTDKQLIDMVEFYDLPSWFASKLIYTGYVMAPEEHSEKADPGNPGIDKDEEYVGVGLGSGVCAEGILDSICKALSSVDGLPEKKMIISGPKFSNRAHREFIIKYPGFIFKKYITNYSDFIKSSKYFIGFAGYNTVSASIQNGNPSLFISRGQSLIGEQQQHIEALEKLGLCIGINEKDACARNIIPALNKLKKHKSKKNKLAVNGGECVADFIQSCISHYVNAD